MRVPELVIESPTSPAEPTEESPLLPRERLPPMRKRYSGDAPEDLESQALQRKGTWYNKINHAYPSLRGLANRTYNVMSNPKRWDMKKVGHKVVVEPALVMPAVFLGLLLNLLDALSYGRIDPFLHISLLSHSRQVSFSSPSAKRSFRRWAQMVCQCST